MNSQQASAEYWKNRNTEENQCIQEKSEQIKSEEFLESQGFELHEYQPHRKISVFFRRIGEMIIYKSVRKNGDIVDGNLLGD